MIILCLTAIGGCGKTSVVPDEPGTFKFLYHPEAYRPSADMPVFEDIAGSLEVKREYNGRTVTEVRRGFRWEWTHPLCFEVELPESSVLALEWGFDYEPGKVSRRYHLTVTVSQGDKEDIVFEVDEPIMPPSGEAIWRSEKITLSNFGPGLAEISFSFDGLAGDNSKDHFILASPRIYNAEKKINRRVVLIGVDTLRADHLSCYDYIRETSPNLDSWAEEGTRYEYCIATSPWTYPSFASILTGRYPAICGATTNLRVLPDDETTIAEVLSREGFSTFMISNNIWTAPAVNLNQGFDTSEAYFAIRADDTFEKVGSWLTSHSDEDTFVFIHLMDPHIPYHPPEPFTDMFDPEYDGRYKDGFFAINQLRDGEIKLTSLEAEHLEALYDGEIAYLDSEFARFLEFLQESETADETLTIFCSDHGEEFNEHGSFGHGHNLYDEAIWVPLIIHGPNIPTGIVEDTVVSTNDIFPTILDYFGIALPDDISGYSLLKPMPEHKRYILSEQLLIGEELKGITTHEYRYIHHTITSEEELYDLSDDRLMQNSVAAERKATCRPFRAFVTKYVVDINAQWHVNFMRGGKRNEELLYSGTIRCPGGFASVDGLQFSEDDSIEISGETCKFSLIVRPATEKELNFVTIDETVDIMFELQCNGQPMVDGDIFIGPSLDKMNEPTFSLNINDERFGLGQPNLRRNYDDGVYIWAIPTRFREQISPDLTPEMEEQLRSIGYLN